MNDIDEQLLLQRLATPATRHEAFELLVKTYAQPLYWKIRRMVLVHEDADDLVQNVFLKAWSALDNFKQQAKLSTWLYRIAINEALDFLRKQKNATGLQGTSDHTLANQLLPMIILMVMPRKLVCWKPLPSCPKCNEPCLTFVISTT